MTGIQVVMHRLKDRRLPSFKDFKRMEAEKEGGGGRVGKDRVERQRSPRRRSRSRERRSRSRERRRRGLERKRSRSRNRDESPFSVAHGNWKKFKQAEKVRALLLFLILPRNI